MKADSSGTSTGVCRWWSKTWNRGKKIWWSQLFTAMKRKCGGTTNGVWKQKMRERRRGRRGGGWVGECYNRKTHITNYWPASPSNDVIVLSMNAAHRGCIYPLELGADRCRGIIGRRWRSWWEWGTFQHWSRSVSCWWGWAPDDRLPSRRRRCRNSCPGGWVSSSRSDPSGGRRSRPRRTTGPPTIWSRAAGTGRGATPAMRTRPLGTRRPVPRAPTGWSARTRGRCTVSRWWCSTPGGRGRRASGWYPMSRISWTYTWSSEGTPYFFLFQ